LNKSNFISDSDMKKWFSLIVQEMFQRIDITNKLINPLPDHF